MLATLDGIVSFVRLFVPSFERKSISSFCLIAFDSWTDREPIQSFRPDLVCSSKASLKMKSISFRWYRIIEDSFSFK